MRNSWLQTVLIGAIFLAVVLYVTADAYAVGGRAGDQLKSAEAAESAESAEAAQATQKSEAKAEEAEHIEHAEHAEMDGDDQHASNDKTDDYNFQPVTQEHLLQGTNDPAYWLMYGGNYAGW